jgi:phosphatidylserine/phosphatidylglycerophosphate/cardiolipin synthase-like enzyme
MTSHGKPTQVVFDNIYDVVIPLIKSPDVVYVVGCMAWFSHKEVIRTLSKKAGVCVITMPDGVSHSNTYRSIYRSLPNISQYGSIRIIDAKVSHGHLMHHKFMIALGPTFHPIWVINGSCNFTQQSEKNRENIVVHYEARILYEFIKEFNHLVSLSTPWKI